MAGFGTLRRTRPFLYMLAIINGCLASITVYHQHGWQVPSVPTSSGMAALANYTGPAAYNPARLLPPTPPRSDALAVQFGIQLSNVVPSGASIQQSGSFMGFSVEMSVADQVCEHPLDHLSYFEVTIPFQKSEKTRMFHYISAFQ